MQKYYVLVIYAICLALSGCNNSPPPAHYKIAIINPSQGLNNVVDGFMAGMKERGYRDGENVTYFYYQVAMAEVHTAIADSKSKGVDLVYTLTTPATFMAKKALAGTGIPLVFAPVFSPVDSGIVDSLAKTGGNLTGLKIRGSTAKALGWLKAVVPDVKRLFVPFHYTDIAACMSLEDLNSAAGKLGVEVVTASFSTPEELMTVVGAIPDNIDVVWVTCSHMLYTHAREIVAAAMARNLPVATGAHVSQSGVLVSYGDDNDRIGKQVSRLVDRILQGESPEDMSVETADYALTINLNTANKLGIHVPDEVLSQADIIER